MPDLTRTQPGTIRRIPQVNQQGLQVGVPPLGRQPVAQQATAPGTPSQAAAPGMAPLGPAVNPALMADPAYAAYIRSLGLDNSLDEAQTIDQTGRVQRGLGANLADLATAGQYQREGVSGGMQQQGFFRSGAHELALARQRAGQGRAEVGLRGGAAESIADLLALLARNQATRHRGAAERAVDTASGLYGGGMG